jgi:hypothetical protein
LVVDKRKLGIDDSSLTLSLSDNNSSLYRKARNLAVFYIAPTMRRHGIRYQAGQHSVPIYAYPLYYISVTALDLFQPAILPDLAKAMG